MTDERYEIRGKIGQGGVGAVYRAYDTQLRREVAIKRVLADGGYEDSDTATKNLLKEATALSSVQHPHICTVYDAGIDKEGPYVVMELINGKTLDEMVERGTLTYEDFREVAIQSQEAMIAAQDLDLVHRDLKPSNVMVCWLPSGRFQVKLVDFGLAKFSAKPSLQTIDHGDAVFGSIFFMAPEQFERSPLDRRTDMYSLGAMYYFALAGTYPFNGDTAPQVMASHLQNTVQPLHEVRPDLPQWLCDWVMWHIKRNMDDRPESARAALEKFLSDESTNNVGNSVQRTGAQLVIPQTGSQPITPASATGGQNFTPQGAITGRVNTGTAPQPISPPNGRSLTSSQRVQPASALTGATAVQPAQPQNAASQMLPGATESTYARPVQAPPEPKAKKGSSFGSMNNTTKIVLASVIGLGIIIFGILIISKLSDNSRTDTYNRLVAEVVDATAKDLPTTKDELIILLDSLTDVQSKDRGAVLKRIYLSKAPDNAYNVDKEISRYATSNIVSDATRENLFNVIGRRGNPIVIEDLLGYAERNPNQTSSRFAIIGAAKNPKDEDFGTYLNILNITENDSVSKVTEDALQKIITQSRKRDRLTTQLIDASQATLDDSRKLSMIRLLGATGTSEAKTKIMESLNSKSTSLRIAAATAFSNWPNTEPLDALITAIQTETTGTVQRALFGSAYQLLADNSDEDKTLLARQWQDLALNASIDNEKKRIIAHMRSSKYPFSKNVIQMFSNGRHSSGVTDYAKEALEKLEEE